MKIVMCVMLILICFLICLVAYLWSDRNFYKGVSKIWSENYERISNMAEKSNDDWANLCEIHIENWTDFCKMIDQDWALKYRELQEENGRLKNQLKKIVKREEDKNVK